MEMGRVVGLISAGMWALLMCFGAGAAQAQDAILKCVGADGRVSYQDSPCAEGKLAGRIERDTRVVDPVALRQAGVSQERADQAAEARAGIYVAANERMVAQRDLRLYLAAAAQGDSEERCRLAGQISREMSAANKEFASQRWNLYGDTDCAAAGEAKRAAQVDESGQVRTAEEPRYIYLGDRQPSPTDKRNRRAGESATGSQVLADTMPIPGIMQSPAPCNTIQCRRK
jgi:Domain of unknown function (DUF4124)